MAKVICTLNNASDEINGVKFKKHPDGHGMVSEDIGDDQAAVFASIPGYELVGATKAAKQPAGKTAEELEAERLAEEQRAAAATELEELRKRAQELGVDAKGNWKAERLRVEIEKAEKAAKDKAAAPAGDGGEQK